MSLLTQVRTIIGDSPQYSKQDYDLKGLPTFQLENFPVIGVSVIITGVALGAYTVYEPTGVVSFAAAPGAQTVVAEYNHVFLLDSQIQDFIDLIGERAFLVSAMCLDTIASTQALIQKKIRILDLETDGPALARALREHAKVLRAADEQLDSEEAGFDWAEQINDAAGWNERMYKEWARGGL